MKKMIKNGGENSTKINIVSLNFMIRKNGDFSARIEQESMRE